jgi:hypothetical protein
MTKRKTRKIDGPLNGMKSFREANRAAGPALPWQKHETDFKSPQFSVSFRSLLPARFFRLIYVRKRRQKYLRVS